MDQILTTSKSNAQCYAIALRPAHETKWGTLYETYCHPPLFVDDQDCVLYVNSVSDIIAICTVATQINPDFMELTDMFNTVMAFFWENTLAAVVVAERTRRRHHQKIILAHLLQEVGSNVFQFL